MYLSIYLSMCMDGPFCDFLRIRQDSVDLGSILVFVWTSDVRVDTSGVQNWVIVAHNSLF